MHQYTRTDEDESSYEPPFTAEPPLEGWKGHCLKLYRKWRPPKNRTVSGYLTLIPLSDERLGWRPTRMKIIMACLVAGFIAVFIAGFVLVPRGVNQGEINVESQQMSWNMTKGTYQLSLLVRLPVYNNNYLSTTVTGNVSIYFFDDHAGTSLIGPLRISKRTMPEVLEVQLDASNLSPTYALTILNQCAAFPRTLIFFLKGYVKAHNMLQPDVVMPFDTYFMISCVSHDGTTMPDPEEGFAPFSDAQHDPALSISDPRKDPALPTAASGMISSR